MVMVTQEERLMRFVTIIRSASFWASQPIDDAMIWLKKFWTGKASPSECELFTNSCNFSKSPRGSRWDQSSANTVDRGRAHLSLDLWLETLFYITLACDLWFDHIIWGVSNISATWNWKVLKSTLGECTVSWVQLQYLYIWCRNKAFRHRIKMWGV